MRLLGDIHTSSVRALWYHPLPSAVRLDSVYWVDIPDQICEHYDH